MTKPWVKLTKIFFSYQFQNHSSSIYKICLFQVCITLAKNDPIKKVFHMKHLDLKSRFFILRTNTFNLWIFYRTVHLKLNEFGKLADFIWKCFGLLLILTAETSIILHRQYNIFIFHFHCLLVNCYYFFWKLLFLLQRPDYETWINWVLASQFSLFWPWKTLVQHLLEQNELSFVK